MNGTLVWQLAWRYLRGKRSANAVPILSRISIVAIGIASCAMIVLFSVFNGFVYLVEDLYKAFYPDIKITAAKGKFFAFDEDKMRAVSSVTGVAHISRSLEDNILLNANDEQRVATVKGIDENFFTVNDVQPYIIDGSTQVSATPATAIVGLQIINEMGLDVNNVFSMLTLYYPNAQSANLGLAPESAFQSLRLKPDGIFRIQEEFDSKYILAPLSLVQSLLQAHNQYSSVEILLTPNADMDKVRDALQKQLGGDYRIATRFEQNRTLYMVMRTEKWAVYAILLLVMLIASFNMIGALSLLVLEKQKDMAILRAMGAQPSTIRNVFIAEGLLWSLSGAAIGLVSGLLLCLGQYHFQWIRLQGSFIIEAYPVKMEWTDFIVVILTVLCVGILAAWLPAMRARKTVQLRSS